MRLIPSCRYLRLKLPEIYEDVILYQMIKFKETKSERKSQEYNELQKLLRGEKLFPGFIPYEPYCDKLKGSCVVLESQIISEQFGFNYQPLLLTIVNSDRIPECKDRELPSNSINGNQPLDLFLLTLVTRNLAGKF